MLKTTLSFIQRKKQHASRNDKNRVQYATSIVGLYKGAIVLKQREIVILGESLDVGGEAINQSHHHWPGSSFGANFW